MNSESDTSSNPQDNVIATNDKTANKSGNDPAQDKPPRKPSWFARLVGLLPMFGELIIAGVVSGILDKASEYASSHGLEKISGVLKFLSLVSLLALIPLIAIKFTGRIRLVWGLFSGAVALLGIILLLVEKHSPDTSAFTFSVRSMKEPSIRVLLTNDFLVRETSTILHENRGALYVPVSLGDSNIILNFTVAVSPEQAAESMQVLVQIPKNLESLMGPPWLKAEAPGSVLSSNRFGSALIEMESWVYVAPFTILPGNSVELPAITVRRLPRFDASSFSMSIMVRAKDAAAKSVSFFLFAIPVSTNRNLSPFVVLGRDAPDGCIEFLSVEELAEVLR